MIEPEKDTSFSGRQCKLIENILLNMFQNGIFIK